MTFLLEILLGVSLVIIITLGVAVRNLLLQNEQLEDTLVETIKELREKIENAYEDIQKADIRGSFEADDEVGSVFTTLKDIITNLRNII
jgi:hypothetical protein